VRRTGGHTSAANSCSCKGGEGVEPNRRSETSKPQREAPSALGPAADFAAETAPGLHLVATPIGNLGDVSLRALAVLRGADLVYCEDTRVTVRLLARYGIKVRVASYHDRNAEEVRPSILAALRRGERVALVSDAGTPLISDPGYKLVRAALAENLPVTAAPGPSAALTALILSGLPPNVFLFVGFLPPRSSARRRALRDWAPLAATLIFYEGPSRLAASLADMAEILGDRPAAVARELTKLHEEVRRDRLPGLAAYYRKPGQPHGEVTIVVGPPAPAMPAPEEIEAKLRIELVRLGVREAAAKVAGETGLPRSELYRRALALRRGGK
jgi:16S rRNA (cytidine1402-2'-O)-methyltransferase